MPSPSSSHFFCLSRLKTAIVLRQSKAIKVKSCSNGLRIGPIHGEPLTSEAGLPIGTRLLSFSAMLWSCGQRSMGQVGPRHKHSRSGHWTGLFYPVRHPQMLKQSFFPTILSGGCNLPFSCHLFLIKLMDICKVFWPQFCHIILVRVR